MSKEIKLTPWPQIYIALATGLCIIIMAYFSKRILTEPIGFLPLAIPPFLMTIHSAFYKRMHEKKLWATSWWVIAIFVSTAGIILLHAI